MQEQRLI